jgi:hypothetical protein
MSPSQTRKYRGYATQKLVAQWFAARGWPFAESTGAGRPGVDITGMPDLAVEVKATAGDVTGALAQANRNRGEGLPFVAWRPNGYGPERIASWPVIMRLDDFTTLLHAAGYGDTGARRLHLTDADIGHSTRMALAHVEEMPEPEHEQGDVPDDGTSDDPWVPSLLERLMVPLDPPQPVSLPCPGEPDCPLADSGHVHYEHP